MDKKQAMDLLKHDGWDNIGAYEIVKTLEDNDLLDNITVSELIALSNDYKDR